MKNYESLHTFVICAYKDSVYLEECINSLTKQTVKSRILISTATPSEKLFSIANKYGIEVKLNDCGGSIGKDWNNGWRAAETDIVTLTHQDDIYLPSYAETAIEGIMSQDANIFFSNYNEINDDTHIIKRNVNMFIKDAMLMPLLISKKNSKIRKGILALGSPICCPAVTYNKKKLQEFNFSEELKCALDWEAYTRINKKEGAWVYCPERLVQHRIHLGSATTELIENKIRTQEELQIFKEYWPEPIAKALSGLYSGAQKTNCK